MYYLNTYTFDGEQVLTFRLKDLDLTALPTIKTSAQTYLIYNQYITAAEESILCQEIAPSEIAGITMINNTAQSFIQMYYKQNYQMIIIDAPNGAPRKIYYGNTIHGKKIGNGFCFSIDGKTLYVENMPYIVIRKNT